MNATANNKTIIITGDWFVDEYWFVVRHQSTVSSHTGQIHYRIYSKRDQPVKDLCGAGLVARVMYDVRGKENDPQLIGIGTWHPRDLNLIAHFVHAKCKQELGWDFGSVICNSYALMPKTCDKEVRITLYNLLDPVNPYEEKDSCFLKDKEGTTIRVVRSYRFDGKKFKQLSRIDWEPDKKDRWNQSDIKEIMLRIKDNDEFSVIIDDHNKDTVDATLIYELKFLHGKTKSWFIRTKNKNIIFGENNVPWLEDFNQEIQLVALGPEISTRFYPVGGLLTKDGKIARHAFEMINALIQTHKKIDQDKEINIRVKNLILASDKLELIFVTKISGSNSEEINAEIYVWRPPRDFKNIELEKINWTSAIFASLAYKLIIPGRDTYLGILQKAINNAHKHSGVNDPLILKSETKQTETEEWKEINIETHEEWKKLKEEWKEFMHPVIKIVGGSNENNELQLQVWRACTDLPGYITCVEGKRESIKRIWEKMINFRMNPEVNKSCGILLEADPGVGKTFLARRLAEELGFKSIQHDITQMVNREELLDLFDMVATEQAEKNYNGLVVFIDEINATLQGSNVYGAFLSPLEAGYYMRRGVKFNLKPCIWIFAGTRVEKENKEEKLEDFMSRLSLVEKIDYKALQIGCLDKTPTEKEIKKEILNIFNEKIQHKTKSAPSVNRDNFVKEFFSLDAERKKPLENFLNEIKKNDELKYKITNTLGQLFDLDRQARLEQVYLGAKLVNDAFCDVLRIEKKVLDIFYRLDPTMAPARRIGRLAESLQDVQYGKVDGKNCAGTDWERARQETDVKFGGALEYFQLNFGG